MFLQLFLLLITIPALFAVANGLYIITKILLSRWKYRHLPTPNFNGIFFLAPIYEVRKAEEAGSHISAVLAKWCKECGPVYVVFIINRTVVMCLEPSVIKEVLINTKSDKPAEFYGVFHTIFNQRYFGNGLFSEVDTGKWEKRRKMFNPAFKRGYLIGLMDHYNSSVQELVSHLKPVADGKREILMADELNKVALDIIAKVAFGISDLNVIADDSAPFCKAVSKSLTGFIWQLQMPYIWQFDFRKKNRTLIKDSVEAIKLIRQTAKTCILHRIEDINSGKDYPQDILTHILRISNNLESDDFGLEEMIDEFLTFFIAGQETTAQLMSFTFELAGRNPDVYAKLQDEVDRVIGNKETVSYEDISQLKYMTMVFKEVLRYAPPVTGIQRKNVNDIVINRYKIPAGSTIDLNHYAFGRDERFWDNPEEFIPERFQEENIRHLYAYFPFSLGPRICIGQHFAMIEAKVIIARLLRMFEVRLVPGVELHYISEVTLKPKFRTPVYLTSRDRE